MHMPYPQQLRPTLSPGHLQWLAALCSLAAAGVHFAVAPEHFAEYWLFGWFFIVVAWLQAVWAIAITSRPNRWLLITGLAGNLALVTIWLWTRLVGVPMGPGSGDVEAFGWTDGLSVILELGVAALTTALILPLPLRDSRSSSMAATVLLGSLLMVAVLGGVLSRDSHPTTENSTTTTEPGGHH